MININDTSMTLKSTELISNLSYFEKFGQPIVDEYSRDLDEKVGAIKNYLDQCRQFNLDLDLLSLQKIVIDLSTTIYYVNDKLEKLGVLEDLSNIKYKDRYNEAYLTKQGNHDAGTKYTVEQLRNYAEQEAIEEKLISFIYSHAAKILKGKIDSANEVLKACSKSLSGVIQSMSTYQASNRYHS